MDTDVTLRSLYTLRDEWTLSAHRQIIWQTDTFPIAKRTVDTITIHSLSLSLSLCMCVCACTWMCGIQHGATVLRAGSWWAHAWLQAVQDSAEPAVEGEDRLPSVQSPQSGHSLWAMMTLLSYWFHWSNRHDPITARRGMFMMIVRSIVKSLLLLIVH